MLFYELRNTDQQISHSILYSKESDWKFIFHGSDYYYYYYYYTLNSEWKPLCFLFHFSVMSDMGDKIQELESKFN